MSKYQFGYTDPRAAMSVVDDLGSPLQHRSRTGFEDVDTETLRNLWMVRFGSRGITMRQLYDVRGEDINMVAQELYYRGEVTQEVIHKQNTLEVETFFIMKKEQDGDH